MTAPLVAIRCTMPDGTVHIEHVVGMSVACAHRPDAVALDLVDGGPDWRRVGPVLLAALEALQIETWRLTHQLAITRFAGRTGDAVDVALTAARAAIAAARGDER